MGPHPLHRVPGRVIAAGIPVEGAPRRPLTVNLAARENEMMIRIDDPEIDRLARELARRLGTTVENAVMRALQECLGRTPDELPARRAERLLEIGRRLAAFPDHDTRTADEILGYDEMGLPT